MYISNKNKTLIAWLISFILLISYSTKAFSSENSNKNINIYNIKSQTETYRSYYFKFSHDNNELSLHVNDYINYVDRAIAVLTVGLLSNDELYEKLLTLPLKKNRELVFIKTGDKKVDAYTAFLKENGLKLRSTEGTLQIYIDPLYFVNNFKDVLPTLFIDYFRIDYEDLNEGYEEDGTLVIEWDSLRKKIIRLENYLQRYESEIACGYTKMMATRKISRFLKDYLIGLPNDEIYTDDKMVKNEIKKSYEAYLQENINSRYYPVIKYFYGKLKENKFKVNESLYSDRELIRLFHKTGLMFFKYR